MTTIANMCHDELMNIYQHSTDEREFFQRYMTTLDESVRSDKELRELMLADAKADGRHLFHLSFRDIDGTEYLFVNDALSLILWMPLKFTSLVLLTQDIPTIKYFLSIGYFDDDEVLSRNKRMIMYTLNPAIYKVFEYKCGQDKFDDTTYSIIYPLLCYLLDYVRLHPNLFEYHRDNLNNCISIMSIYFGIVCNEIHNLSDTHVVLNSLLSNDVYGRMSRYKHHYDISIMDFDNWRYHKLNE